MVDVLKRIMGWFQKRPFDDEVAALFREYGVDPNTLKTMDDFAAAAHEVIERATQDGTPRGKDVVAQLAFYLGGVHSDAGNMQEAVVKWREVVKLGKESDTPRVLELAATAALALIDESPIAEKRVELYYEAMELGEKSDTPLGLSAAAMGALGVGLSLGQLAHWLVRDTEKAKWAWRRAVELGCRSGTQKGLESAAMAAVDLGQELDAEDWLRSLKLEPARLEAEEWYQRGIDLGLKSGTGEGQAWAQRAKNLLDQLQQQGKLP